MSLFAARTTSRATIPSASATPRPVAISSNDRCRSRSSLAMSRYVDKNSASFPRPSRFARLTSDATAFSATSNAVRKSLGSS